jgi:predicted N-acetyltransferase YhbS
MKNYSLHHFNHESPKTIASILDLTLFCQNTEAHLGLTLTEQPGLLDIQGHYVDAGGDFVFATDDTDKVVGTIALLPLTATTAALEKFFTYPEWRGKTGLAFKLYQELIHAAKINNFKQIYLDTPASSLRAHHFYERQGFQRINRSDLPASYEFPDTNAWAYMLELN